MDRQKDREMDRQAKDEKRFPHASLWAGDTKIMVRLWNKTLLFVLITLDTEFMMESIAMGYENRPVAYFHSILSTGVETLMISAMWWSPFTSEC